MGQLTDEVELLEKFGNMVDNLTAAIYGCENVVAKVTQPAIEKMVDTWIFYKRSMLMVKLSRFLPVKIASFISDHWPRKWL